MKQRDPSLWARFSDKQHGLPGWSIVEDKTASPHAPPTRLRWVDRFRQHASAVGFCAGDPYRYRVDGAGIQQAAEQGIITGHNVSLIYVMQ